MPAGSINALIGAQRSGSVLDAIAHPPQINPLGGIQAGADAAKTVIGMRQLAAQKAWGDALAGATDQTTGVVDYPSALKTFSASPYAGYGMQSAVTGASPMQNDQVSRAHYQLGVYQGLVGSLDENAPPAQLRAQLNATFDRAAALGLSPTDVATERAAIPKDDAALPGFVHQLRMSGESGLNQIGKPFTINQGTDIVGGVQDPRTGALKPAGAAVPLGLTSEQLLEPSTNPPPERDAQGVPTGRTIPMSKGEVLEMEGLLPKGTMDRLKAGIGSMGTGRPQPPNPNLANPAKPAAAAPPPAATPPAPAPSAPTPATPPPAAPAIAPIPPPATSPSAPQGVPVTANPLMPPGVQVAAAGSGFAPGVGPAAPPGSAVGGDVNAIMGGIRQAQAARGGAPAVAPAAAPGAGGGTTFNLPTGRAALTLSPDEEFRLKNAGPDFRKEVDTGTNAIQQSALLGNMLADAAGFVPGKGATGLQDFENRVQYWAPGIAKGFGIDPTALANKEGFDKIAAQIANSQGAQSDARLAVVEAATPHSEMTPQGVDKIIRQLQGNSDYLQYRAKMAAIYPKQYDYRGFQQDVQKLDPRVFQLTRMTDPQRKEYWGNLDSTAQTELGNAIRYKAAMDKQLTGQ